MEITVSQTSASFAEIRTFAAEVFLKCRLVLFGRSVWRVGGLELVVPSLAIVHIAEYIKIMIEEIYSSLVAVNRKQREDLQSWVTLANRLTLGS